MALPERHLRVIQLMKKKPELSDEEFHTHWRKTHGPLVAPLMQKHGFLEYIQVSSCRPMLLTLLTYEQIHTPSSIKDALASVDAEKAALGNSFDGYASFLIPGLETVMKLYMDPEFQDKIVPDEEKFIDTKSSTLIVAGFEESFLKDAKLTNLG